MGSDDADRRAKPPRLPGDLIVRLVEAHSRNSLRHLPMCHADDVLPLLKGNDREYDAAVKLLDAAKLFHPYKNHDQSEVENAFVEVKAEKACPPVHSHQRASGGIRGRR
ncbi:hypothetical protein JMUB6875_77310 [Nocardia sp. JMUB6875]